MQFCNVGNTHTEKKDFESMSDRGSKTYVPITEGGILYTLTSFTMPPRGNGDVTVSFSPRRKQRLRKSDYFAESPTAHQRESQNCHPGCDATVPGWLADAPV